MKDFRIVKAVPIADFVLGRVDFVEWDHCVLTLHLFKHCILHLLLRRLLLKEAWLLERPWP